MKKDIQFWQTPPMSACVSFRVSWQFSLSVGEYRIFNRVSGIGRGARDLGFCREL